MLLQIFSTEVGNPQTTTVTFHSDKPIDDAVLPHLPAVRRLDTLGLTKAGITDAGLARVAELTVLKSLNLSDNQITDAGLVHVET